MNGNCSKWQQCEAFKKRKDCFGCSYQHFEPLLKAQGSKGFLKDVGDKLFDASSKRMGRGGRIDKPIREAISQLFIKELEEFKIRELPNKELNGQIVNIGEELKVKSDGAFQVQIRGKTVYIFYEVKGYGDNSNDILSAITAAHLVKEMPKFEHSLYYYIGVNSSRDKSGFTRKSLSKGIKPYIKWAESKEFLWFYGIVEVDELLTDIGKRLTSWQVRKK
ncbi:MAG: hypothetical protein J7L92_03660 [Dehalococcoidia bacterium]|nr:hypothetical protein [Dehalococcoidia bacterium]